MPASLKLKNIPDDVYERLKASAELHRRSVSSEAIGVLKSALAPDRLVPAVRLERIRMLRESLGTARLCAHPGPLGRATRRKPNQDHPHQRPQRAESGP